MKRKRKLTEERTRRELTDSLSGQRSRNQQRDEDEERRRKLTEERMRRELTDSLSGPSSRNQQRSDADADRRNEDQRHDQRKQELTGTNRTRFPAQNGRK